MTDPKAILQRLHKSLNILQEREAKYGLDVPLALINEIEDHQTALTLTQDLIAGHLTETDWREQLRPLLVKIKERGATEPVSALNIGGVSFGDITIGGDVVGGDKVQQTAGDYSAQASHGSTSTVNAPTYNISQTEEDPPFWKQLSRLQIVLAIVLGLIATSAAVLAVPGASNMVYIWFAPLPFPPATDNETLIVIATFYETNTTKSEPHTKIRRAIEKAAENIGLDHLRVEEEPTILKADDRKAAEELVNRYQAEMIIWGEDTGLEVIVNFLSPQTRYLAVGDVTISEHEKVPIVNPKAYAAFIVEDLPEQLTFFSLFVTGHLLGSKGNYDQALKTIKAAIASWQPDDKSMLLSEAYFHLGWLYTVPFVDYDKAITAYDNSLQNDSQNTNALRNRGFVYARLGQYEQAIEDYTKAIDLDPQDATTYNSRGVAYGNLNQYEQAIEDYTKAMDHDPENADAYNHRGFVYNDQGNYEAAITDFNKAIKIDPDYAYAYNNRGKAYYDQGNLEQALSDFNKAIELNHDLPRWPYNNRGKVYYDQGNLEQAIADFNLAIEAEPEYVETYYNRGLAYEDLGELEKAVDDYERYLELEPETKNKEAMLEKIEELKAKLTEEN